MLLASVFYCYHNNCYHKNKTKMINRWIYEPNERKKKCIYRLSLFHFFGAIRLNSEPRFLVQFIVFRNVYRYGACHLFSILVLAIIVNEFAVRIDQVHDNCVINLPKLVIVSTLVGNKLYKKTLSANRKVNGGISNYSRWQFLANFRLFVEKLASFREMIPNC